MFNRMSRFPRYSGMAVNSDDWKARTFRFSEKDINEIKLNRFFDFWEDQRLNYPEHWGTINLLFPRYMDSYRHPFLSVAFRNFSATLVEQFPLLSYTLSSDQPALWNIGLSLVDQLSAWEIPHLYAFSLQIDSDALSFVVERLIKDARNSVSTQAITFADKRECAIRAYFERLYQARVTVSSC